MRDFVSSWRAITNGVVAKTTKERQKYWGHWCSYAYMCGIDPTLQTTNAIERDVVVCGFANRVRTGYYGGGNQIRVQSVTTALSAISKTIQLAGKQSPIYRNAEEDYQLAIARLVEGYRREDPPAVPQLAIPISVPNVCFNNAQTSSDPCTQATGCMILIAFYYLLRVGEYTKPKYTTRNGKQVRATRTVQFMVGNVGFFKHGKQIPRSSSLPTLLSCDAATLKITNQKNGRMGSTIHHKSNGKSACPVKALAKRVHHILSNGGASSNLLCDYSVNGNWHSLTSSNIITMVRTTCTQLKLDEQGIDADLVGAHSLRAGGAMSLKLHGYNDTTIMKMGRWTSLTFLEYIHSQIAHLSEDISKKMSMPLPFLNIAAISQN